MRARLGCPSALAADLPLRRGDYLSSHDGRLLNQTTAHFAARRRNCWTLLAHSG
jgi:hypothetical protein